MSPCVGARNAGHGFSQLSGPNYFDFDVYELSRPPSKGPILGGVRSTRNPPAPSRHRNIAMDPTAASRVSGQPGREGGRQGGMLPQFHGGCRLRAPTRLRAQTRPTWQRAAARRDRHCPPDCAEPLACLDVTGRSEEPSPWIFASPRKRSRSARRSGPSSATTCRTDIRERMRLGYPAAQGRHGPLAAHPQRAGWARRPGRRNGVAPAGPPIQKMIFLEENQLGTGARTASPSTSPCSARC